MLDDVVVGGGMSDEARGERVCALCPDVLESWCEC